MTPWRIYMLARNPDCIGAVFPEDGGVWGACCRSGVAMPEPAPEYSGESEAERLRLISKVNITTDNGVFENAVKSPITGGAVKTKLDLRGNTTGKTFITRANYAVTADAVTRMHPAVTQGSTSSSANAAGYIFLTGIFKYSSYGVYPLFTVSNGTTWVGWRGISGPDCSAYLGAMHTYAYTTDPDSVPGKNMMRFFVDGELLAEQQTGDVGAWNSGSGTDLAELSVKRDFYTAYISPDDRVEWALVFDRAMSPTEIATIRQEES